MGEYVVTAYLMPVPFNQVSVPVGDVPWMVAKAMHPKEWNFWEGRQALFKSLVARLWARVSLAFPGQVAAAKEVRFILESQNEKPVLKLLPELSGNHLYQLYLAGVHKRLIYRAVDDGSITLIDSNPLCAYPIKKDEFGMIGFRPSDRVKVSNLSKYLRRYGVIVDETATVAEVKEEVDKKPRVLVDEKRGKIILRVVSAMNMDPENLPAYRSGHSTVKIKIRERLKEVALTDFAPDGDLRKFNKAFDRAWSWLIKSKRINHPKADS
ncbi:hypothetical protein [Marinobacter subterrani]|uniref:hypothetical protein n=1 Tax=Marinobacter subterrani TaxID=1658765 RepID=UPI002352F3F7|nr:hypothetical protein [Marinobacter subterrani]